MQYLQDLQHYEDRYDLWTIEQCIRQTDMLRKVSKVEINENGTTAILDISGGKR